MNRCLFPLLVILSLTVIFGEPAAVADTRSDAHPVSTVNPWTAPDQEAAQNRAGKTAPFVSDVLDECQLCRQQRLRDQGLGIKDIKERYFLLDSPVIKQIEDHYGPVRFMHGKHAALVNDCAVCHHFRPKDATASETTRCSACHQEPFKADHPGRLGLKAAYHQQCMECHEDMAKGPTGCIGCHAKNVPDHAGHIQLPENPEPTQVTKECLRCHEAAGTDMLKTAHWLWKGPSPYTLDHRKDVELGKATLAFNNF